MIEINNENKNELSRYIKTQDGIFLGKYKIIKAAFLLDAEVLSPALVEKVQENGVLPSNECEQK